MGAFLLQFLVKMISTELTKTVIGYGVNKLVEHTDDGITKDIAVAMIDGIARSRANNVPENAFDAIKQSL